MAALRPRFPRPFGNRESNSSVGESQNLGGAQSCRVQSSKVPTYVLPRHVTFTTRTPPSVSCQTIPSNVTEVPGSQGPKQSGSVIVPTEVPTQTSTISFGSHLIFLAGGESGPSSQLLLDAPIFMADDPRSEVELVQELFVLDVERIIEDVDLSNDEEDVSCVEIDTDDVVMEECCICDCGCDVESCCDCCEFSSLFDPGGPGAFGVLLDDPELPGVPEFVDAIISPEDTCPLPLF